MKRKYKIVDSYSGNIFFEYKLSDLALTKNKKRKGLGCKDSVYSLLWLFLEDYGVFINGRTKIYNLDGNETEDLEVLKVSIRCDFPLKNEAILRQLYGYNSAKVDIGLFLQSDEDCAYSFMYNLDDFSCEFFRHYHWNKTSLGKFEDFKSMMKYLKENYGK